MVKRAAPKARKRPRNAESVEEQEGAGFFYLDDDDQQKQQQSEEEDEEQQETAEQKRIRLARKYLNDLREAAGDDEDGGLDTAAGDEEVAEKLRLDALEQSGRLQRKLAHRVQTPQLAAAAAAAAAAATDGASVSSSRYGSGRFCRAHRLSPTALALSADERTAYTVSKDGTILRWDLETMKRTQLVRPGSKAAAAAAAAAGTTADWVKRGPRQNPTSSLLAAALSTDGKYLVVGGGDKAVHVFDAGSGAHVAAYPGHRDQVTGLSFRPGTHTLYSCSQDRTVKIWSLDDAAYVDSLFGHQAEVFAVAAARSERVVTTGHDHTCRYWKVLEESHLVFRSPSMAQHAVALINNQEWLSGGCDGTLQVWNTMKKKPVSITRNAHAHQDSHPAAAAAAAAADGDTEQPPASGSWATACVDTPAWIQSIAVAPLSDLVASGAGDGFVRLWQVQPSKHGGAGALRQVGALPAAGYVNGLALGKSGTLAVAALGQEPRLGRWGRIGSARNGLLLHRWSLADDGAGGSDESD